jgi:myo-inositol-1(or 4)-monophosphatase
MASRYAVSVAAGNELTHAVVLDPSHDELFTAVKGRGAQLNGAPIRASACTRIQDALIGTVIPPRRSPRLPRYLPIFNALAARCTLRRAGSCSLDLAYVAAGRLMACRDEPRYGTPLLCLAGRGAGGRASLAGNPSSARHEVIAAAAGVFGPLRENIVASAPIGPPHA